MDAIDTATLRRLCDSVMRGVVASGCMTGASPAKITAACEIMRAEIKDLLLAERYAAAREAVETRAMSDAYVVALVAAECTAKIAAFKEG